MHINKAIYHLTLSLIRYTDAMNRRRVLQIISAVLVVAIIIGGYAAFSLYNKADAALANVTKAGSNSKLTDLLEPEALNGEETGRVNLLIAGNSADDPGHNGSSLTDSIMVASMDMTTKKLTLISIPRDLWVNYGGSSMKINAVYTQGGMDALKQQVEGILGITINHQVLINYSAFKSMIDAVGGIDVTIDSSDSRGIYDPMIGFSIGNGTQHLDGTQALLLARSRNDPTYDGRIAYGLPNGDFDRQMYQRKILQVLITKLTTVKTLINPTTLPDIIDSFSGNVTSDLTAGQLRRLYDLSKQISTTDSISIRGDDNSLLLADYTSYNGQSALIPRAGADDYTVIKQYVATYMTAQQTAATQ
ncbi:MAG: cell envelope-related function transcriptional attenuator, LytR/CpsA family protein nonfunctional [Candidatus Saccharibacteria bacterium]|nr:cell envelope-related function transcriptional attenuator, LytR/CpsA family protein nonfunctional [Candidatus Saccharibacteria bacterium]